MSSDLTTRIKLSGSKEQLSAMLSAIQTYDKNLWSIDTIDSLLKEAKDDVLEIELMGPYGKYNFQELKLFEHIADEVPNAEFDISICGFATGAEVGLFGKLEHSLLTIRKNIINDEDIDHAYIEYFRKKIPLAKFRKLFKVNGLNEDYADCIAGCFYDFPDCDYNSFVDYWEDCELEEEDFEEVLEKLEDMGIVGFDEFRDENIDTISDARAKVIIYDPITHSYCDDNLDEICDDNLDEYDENLDGFDQDEFASPKDITIIKDGEFIKRTDLTNIKIPEGVTHIGDYAFYGCTNLTSVTIPDSVISIGEYAFWQCTNLASVTIPDSVITIGVHAFWQCTNLTRVTIGNSVTSIAWGAFSNCTNLTSVTIGNSVTTIDNGVFSNCTNLTSVTIGNSVTTIGEWAFKGCTNLTSVTIGNSVTAIGDDAFRNCDSLTSVTIPNSVITIGKGAFFGCTNLASVTIGESVTTIGSSAFCDCSNLTSITIGNSVTNIGQNAFSDCPKLTSIFFEDTTPWYRTTKISYYYSKTGGTRTSVTDSSTNATYFNSRYSSYYWYKK